jgi:hypothetical protein
VRLAVRRYRTEIVIPADRTIQIQLPEDLPEGRAVVLVEILERDPWETDAPDHGVDHDDIEWWDEFGDDDMDSDAESGLRLAAYVD